MSDNLFVKKREFTSLERFARFIFTLCQFGNVEEHHSANYWGGEYYLAFRNEACLTIALQDHPGFQDYDYWLSIELPTRNFEDEVELGRSLAQVLVMNDFEVSRPLSREDWLYERPVVQRIVYCKKLSGGDSGNQGAVVEETLEDFKVP